MSLAGAVIAALGLTSRVDAVHALTQRTTDASLARASAAAVRGIVVGVSARRDPAIGAIYTHVLLDVTRAWGFAVPPARLALKLLGGALGGESLVVGGQARFTPGEEVIAFLDVRPRDHTLSIAGLDRGKWTVRPADTGRAVATRLRHDRAVPDAVDLAALEALAALAGSGVHLPPAVVAVPGAVEASAFGAGGVDAAGPVVGRWHEADWGAAVAVDSAFGGHPLFPMGGLTQFLRAIGAWSAAGPLQLSPGIARSARCFGNDEWPDGRISVGYDDPCGEIADTSPMLAIGGAYLSSADVRDVGGTPFWKITKGMVILDNVLAKFSGMSTGCYEELLTHELGHAVGLGHSPIGPAVMAPTLSPACVNRTESLPLQATDLDALRTLYPPAHTAPGPPSAPGGLWAQVDGHHVTLGWMASAGAPATTYQLEAGSLPGASDHGAVAVNLQTFTAPQVGTGVYYVRVIALNAYGASAPSADLAVVVGAGLPGAPTGMVAAGGPKGAIRVLWTPPPGPAPTHYVLLAGDLPGSIAARIPVVGPSLVADHVPSGTYFVRVAAVNAVGMGPVSPEISVVVP